MTNKKKDDNIHTTWKVTKRASGRLQRLRFTDEVRVGIRIVLQQWLQSVVDILVVRIKPLDLLGSE